MSATPPPFPFIVGCGRSGTTLLRAMLDAHPDVAVPDEVAFIVRYSRPHYAIHYGWPRRFDAARCAELILADNSFRRWRLDEHAARAALTEPDPGSFPDAVRRVYGLVAAGRSKPRYADKTPRHVLHLRRLSRLFPEARFVHVVRDGRDVAASYCSVAWGPATVEEAAVHWRRSVRHGRRAGGRLGARRYLEIHYEDLVADQVRVLGEVCRFLDLRWDDAVLHHDDQAAAVVAATRFPEAHRNVLLRPTPGLRDWRGELTSDEVVRFEAIGGELLEELGYGRSDGRPALSARVRGMQTIASDVVRRTVVQSRAGVRVLARGGASR